jgi:uncharacterized protein (DUF3820 family)
MEPMKMPFGKYKGEPVEDIPADYLEWALENCDLRPALQVEMEAQLAMKRGEGASRGRA